MSDAIRIAVTNESTSIDDTSVQFLVEACQLQAIECADAWGIPRVTVSFYDKGADLPPATTHLMAIVDQIDVPDALGYHTDYGGVIYGQVLAQSVVDTGVTLSHEVLEMLVDPDAEEWRGDVALEVCLAGDTKVVLAGGGQVSIRDLSRSGGSFSVIAHDPDAGPVAAVGNSSRLTARDASVVRVSLSNGEFVRCTPTHRILCSDGVYRMAGDLKSGDRLKMGPGSQGAHAPNSRAGHAISSGEHGQGLSARADVQSGSFSELRCATGLSAQIPISRHPPLRRRIQHVFPVCSEKQMVRVGAKGVVARVTHLLARGYRTLVEHVRHAMDKVALLSEGDLAIAFAVLGPWPIPASIPPQNPSIENVSHRRRTGAVVTGESGIKAPVSFHASPVQTAQTLGEMRPSAAFSGAGSHCNVVTSVQPDGKSDVYDLTVDGLHNFAIGAGVFVHNCDPVEADVYQSPPVAIETETRQVLLSNYVLPAYFDATASGPYDHMGKLSAPLTMTSGGYQIRRNPDGSSHLVFARRGDVPASFYRKLINPRSRTLRRLRGKAP